MHRLALVLSFALAACATANGDDSQVGEVVPVDLPGEYRVAGVDGQDINLSQGITASITDDRITVRSGCIGMGWSYSREGNTLSTVTQPVPSCRRALLPQEQTISQAFTSAQGVARTPANGIEFSGPDHTVLLFSQ